MRKIHWMVLTVLLGGALAMGQTTPNQPSQTQSSQTPPAPQPLRQPDSNTYPPSASKTAPYQTAQPGNPDQPDAQAQTRPSESRTELGPTGQSQTSSTRGGVPWAWVVVGLGIVVLLLIVLLSGRGSGGTERIERIEEHRDDHHDETRRAA